MNDSSVNNKHVVRDTNTSPKTTSKKHKKKKRKKKHTFLSVILSFCLICFLTVCIIGGYVLTNAFLVINGDAVISLEDEKNNQNQTSFIYAYDSEGKPFEYSRLHGEINRIWVDLEDMPTDLIDAFVAIEDKRFYEHKGVDWYRLGGVISSLSFEQGASTITQQLIKNITGQNEVTIVRKYNEILSALNLEKNYDKNDILEAYLNVVYLGSGCYGVKTASEAYFGKDLNELTLAECSVLASITKAPYSFNPLYNPESNKERRSWCLSEMLTQQMISKAEYNSALNADIIFTNDSRYVADTETELKKKNDDDIKNFYVDYIVDSVIDDLVNDLGFGVSEATKMIYYGGLKIYAAVDPNIQSILEKVYSTRSAFPNPNENDTPDDPAVQSSMTIMDYSGRVVAIVGQAGEKKQDRGLNRATDSPRQPGSSIKPLATYAPGIDKNVITWSTLVSDSPLIINGESWPKNVDGAPSGTKKTVQYAIKVSLNTVPAQILRNTLPGGVSTAFEYLRDRFHLKHIVEGDRDMAPMTVGAMNYGATTLEMAAAYAAFGNGGMYYEPYSYYAVVDSSGEVILPPKDESQKKEKRSTEEILRDIIENNKNTVATRAIQEDTADVMCELLQTVPTSSYGSGYSVQKFPIMCKTGTTDEDKNRWFCAGTPYYVCAIWYGYDIAENMHTTLNPCGKIFLDVFSKIHNNLEMKDFAKSGKTIQKSYCANTGLIAGKHCPVGGQGWYKTSYLPKQCSSCTSIPILDDLEQLIEDTGILELLE
ncbi:MAG: transglycosylase domain-containing protein [Clostridia bacterium]|nr:transglycosylase domain-containing protein [Clostridia bacterium]